MTFDWAATKLAARQVVHNTFAIAANYTGGSSNNVPLSVRVHFKSGKASFSADPENAFVVDDIDMVIFNVSELAAKSVTPERNGTLFFPEYNVTVTLDSQGAYDGPVRQPWVLKSLE